MIQAIVEEVAVGVEKYLQKGVIRGDDYIVIKKRINDSEREYLQNRFEPELIEVSQLDRKTMVKL